MGDATPSPTGPETIVCGNTTASECLDEIRCSGTNDCEVICDGSGACSGRNITCPVTGDYNCEVKCFGDRACADATINMPPDWTGIVYCGMHVDDKDTCNGLHVMIPPPREQYTLGMYWFRCHGRNSCVDAKFEIAEFNVSDPHLAGYYRPAVLYCESDNYSCDNSTKTICPSNFDPNNCFTRKEMTPSPTM